MNEWVGAGRRTDWGGSQGMLAIQLVAIYMGRDHMGFWQYSWWLYTWGGDDGIWTRYGGEGGREEGEVRLSEWGGGG